MTVINTNVSALYSQLALQNTAKSQSTSMEQLSTGLKINSAGDNAAGLAIVNRMKTQISGISQSIQNAGDAVNLIQTAEGAANQITTMLQRMQQLATESANGTYNDSQREDLDLEFQQLKQQIVAISNDTQWNGFPVLNGTAGKQLSPLPVYKTVSAPQQSISNGNVNNTSNLFISPNPSISVTQTNIAQVSTFDISSLSQTVTTDPTQQQYVSFSDGTNTFSVPIGGTAAQTQNALVTAINAGVNGAPNQYTAAINGSGELTITANQAGTALPPDLTVNTGATPSNVIYSVPSSLTAGNQITLNWGNVAFTSNVNTTNNTTPTTVAADLAQQMNANTNFESKYVAVPNGSNTGAGAGTVTIVAKDPTVPVANLAGSFNMLSAATASSTPSVIAPSSSTGFSTSTSVPLDTANSVANYNSGQSLTGQQSFASPGTWVTSGSLKMTLDASNPTASGVSATFTTASGKEVTLQASSFNPQTGTVTFDPSVGYNSQAITGDLTYNVLETGTPPYEADLTSLPPTTLTPPNYTTQINVQVQGSIPTLNAGDLTINGVTVGASLASSDTVSPATNASGSAIAKAAAINAVTAQTGVTAIVNSNQMPGAPMTGASVVSGYVTINGITTPQITTVLNNPRESRAAVVAAVNAISNLTGVTAVDSGSDSLGISLVAPDGRNIEVQFQPTTDGSTSEEFSQRTGLNEGVQAGTYSLESKVNQPIVIGTTAGGNLSDSGLSPGTYTDNQSSVTTQKYTQIQPGQQPQILNSGQSVVEPGQTPVVLNEGDLTINGVPIPGATAADDTSAQDAQVAFESGTNTKQASAIATANAINSVSSLTGVTATANPATVAGAYTSGAAVGPVSLNVNGVAVAMNLGTAQSASDRIQTIITTLNQVTGQTGVVASVNSSGQGVQLTTVDGRNLSVWYETTQGGSPVTAADFGLASNPSNDNAPGVTGITPAQLAADPNGGDNASTVYGTVNLQSSKPIDIEPGVNGYTSSSNFTALGFTAGTFGGVAKDASTMLAPPLVGQLEFQVGPDANQTVSIDLPDFGSNGSITGDITWDVNQTPPAAGTVMPTSASGTPSAQPQRSYISSQSAAEAMITRLGTAIDNISATVSVMGAVMNRLSYVTNNLQSMSVNLSASQSAIEDTDYASASTNLSRTQIMQQAATAVLAQANTSQQTVLKLLQG
jgi:flagellin